ncbi:MAG: hypothetical protein WCR02_10485 [Sphaerochaetaceae bacterium]
MSLAMFEVQQLSIGESDQMNELGKFAGNPSGGNLFEQIDIYIYSESSLIVGSPIHARRRFSRFCLRVS